MRAVFRHELRNYFHSMTVYLFCAALLCFVGIGAMLYNIQSAVANFEYVLDFVTIGLVVIIPVLTMKVIAEEKKLKTDQLLYLLPLKIPHIVIGKYLALLVIFLIPTAIISLYPLIFARFGEVYLPTSYGTLVAFFFLGAAMIAIGTFISSLTDNVGLAVGISIPLFLFNFYSVSLADYVSDSAFGSFAGILVIILLLAFLIRKVTGSVNLGSIVSIAATVIAGALFFIRSSLYEGLLPALMSKLSLFERFYEFVDGMFNVTSLVFYLTVIVFFLFLSVRSLEKRRYN